MLISQVYQLVEQFCTSTYFLMWWPEVLACGVLLGVIRVVKNLMYLGVKKDV